VWGELNYGWALWNFRGPFGVLDTDRPGTKFENWQGHQLESIATHTFAKEDERINQFPETAHGQAHASRRSFT
jgi:hypothetical protein